MTVITVGDSKHAIVDNVLDRPFKLALAMFAVYSGVSGLIGFGASNEIFIEAVKYSVIFNAIFILAGAVMFTGVIIGKINVEASGLFLVVTSLLMRTLATVALVGWAPEAHNLLAISVLFVTASLVRIGVIFHIAAQARKK